MTYLIWNGWSIQKIDETKANPNFCEDAQYSPQNFAGIGGLSDLNTNWAKSIKDSKFPRPKRQPAAAQGPGQNVKQKDPEKNDTGPGILTRI